jgi:hypothetical protein
MAFLRERDVAADNREQSASNLGFWSHLVVQGPARYARPASKVFESVGEPDRFDSALPKQKLYVLILITLLSQVIILR